MVESIECVCVCFSVLLALIQDDLTHQPFNLFSITGSNLSPRLVYAQRGGDGFSSSSRPILTHLWAPVEYIYMYICNWMIVELFQR